MLNKLTGKESKKEYVTNFLSSDEFRNLFYINNKISLEYMCTGGIGSYLDLFQDGSIDEEFLNKEIESNYIEGNYSLLLELYKYITKHNYVNLTNTVFAFLAAIKLKNKKVRSEILKEAKKKRLNINLFLIFILKTQIFLQKRQNNSSLKHRLNKRKRAFLYNVMADGGILRYNQFNNEDKDMKLLKDEIKKAIEDSRFEEALDLCSKVCLYHQNDLEVDKYNDIVIDKIEQINRQECAKQHSDILKRSIVLYNDKNTINKAIRISGFLNDYSIISKCQNSLENIMRSSIFCKATTIGKATYLVNKNRSGNLMKKSLKS